MSTRSAFIGLAGGLALGLGACSSNPLGDPVWSGWDNGQKAVSAYDTHEAETPTGAIPPQETGYSTHYGGTGTSGIQSAPLAPPPGSTASPPGSGPRTGYGSQSYNAPAYGSAPTYGSASSGAPPAAPAPSLAQATLTPDEAARASEAPINPVPPAGTSSAGAPAPVISATASGGPTALHSQLASASGPAPGDFHPTGQKPLTQRTLPLVVAGQGIDRGATAQ